MNIVSQYPSWYYLLCILLGLVFAFFLYRKHKKLEEFSKNLIFLLATLRFLLVFLLAFLLMAPLVKYKKREIIEPLIIIAEDRSSSIKNSEKDKNQEYLATLEQLKNSLSEDYEVNHYFFGEKFRKKDTSNTIQDRYTDYDEVWAGIEDRFANKNIGAVIFLSDGIYNRGSNPKYNSLSKKYPVYSVGLGDTTQRKDLKIDRLIHNEIAFLDNQFPVKVDISQLKLEGENSRLLIKKDGETLHSEKLSFKSASEAFTKDILLTAKEIGLQRYQVVLELVDGERNQLNNVKDFYIQVLDGRQKIALIYGSPHPDIKAIKSAIQENKNFELTVSSANEWKKKVKDFDLLILYQLPNKSSRNVDIINRVNNEKKPVWLIAGSATNTSIYSTTDWPIKSTNQRNQSNEAQAILDNSFPFFTLSDELSKTINDWPPLELGMANYRLNPNSYPLLMQKIGSVETKMPMMAFGEDLDQKSAILYGEGIWKWKLEDYRKTKEFKRFYEFVNKTIQYLSLKTDQSLFRISHQNEIFENEELYFNAQLYNDSYELINEADVSISIFNEEGEEFNYLFNKSGDAYNLRVSGLDDGKYNYEAEVNYAGKKLIEKGEFSVKELQLEYADLVANHNTLYQIAEASGGKFYNEDSLLNIAKDLAKREDINSISYNKDEVEDIINLPWIFFILLALLSLEWFLRKRNGAY